MSEVMNVGVMNVGQSSGIAQIGGTLFLVGLPLLFGVTFQEVIGPEISLEMHAPQTNF